MALELAIKRLRAKESANQKLSRRNQIGQSFEQQEALMNVVSILACQKILEWEHFSKMGHSHLTEKEEANNERWPWRTYSECLESKSTATPRRPTDSRDPTIYNPTNVQIYCLCIEIWRRHWIKLVSHSQNNCFHHNCSHCKNTKMTQQIFVRFKANFTKATRCSVTSEVVGKTLAT